MSVSSRWLVGSMVLVGGALVAACSSTEASKPATDGPAAEPPPATTVDPPSPPGVPEGGANPDGGVDSAAASLSIQQFDQAIAKAVCDKITSCCSDADYAQFFQQFTVKPYDLKTPPSPADCAATLGKQYELLHGKWAGSIAKGRMTYDPARGKTCIDTLNAATCGVSLAKAIYDAACFAPRGNEVFKKVAPLGSACDDISDGTFYGECDPKLGYCGSSKTCEPWKKTGEPCSVTPTRQFCQSDLSCEGLRPNAPGTCSAAPILRQVGESCNEVTGPYVFCAGEAYCDDTTGKCVAAKLDGAACKYDYECKTAHPFTCTPFGNGTCGSKSFCGGRT